MPRPRPLPLEDALLAAAEACGLVHVSRSRWDAYSKRFPTLIRGRRIVQANPGGKGVYRWLRSAVIEHMHRELATEHRLVSDAADDPEVPHAVVPMARSRSTATTRRSDAIP